MNKKIINWLQYIVFLGLAIFLVWWSIGKIEAKDWVEIKTALSKVNYWYILPVVIALLLSHFSRALRWKILMEPMGYKPSTLNTYCAVLVGYLANLAVPRLGEVLKCTILAKYEKVPADKLVGTIVAERAFDLICLVIVFAVTILTQIDIIGSYASGLVKEIVYSKSGSLSLVRFAIIIVAIVVVLFIIRFILHRFAHIHVIKKIKNILKGVWQGLISVKDVKNKGFFFFHTAVIWILYLLSIRIGFYAMQSTSMYGIKPSLSVLSLGSIGMIVTQGGIGAYPILIQETMMLYGLTENLGKAFGWLLWLVQFFLVLVFGALSVGLLPLINRNKTTPHAQR
jgi:glycosyltransferase 2 family protein